MFVSKVNLLMAPFKKIAFDGRFWTWSIIILMNGLVGRILRRFLVLDPPGRELFLLGLEQGSPIWDPDFFFKNKFQSQTPYFRKKISNPEKLSQISEIPGIPNPRFCIPVIFWDEHKKEITNSRFWKWIQKSQMSKMSPKSKISTMNPKSKSKSRKSRDSRI